MRRIVITPCGTSLRESALCWEHLPSPLTRQHSWRDIRLDPALFEAVRGLRRDLWLSGASAEAIAGKFDRTAWDRPELHRLSAELASLRLIHSKHVLGRDDWILLVHGNDDLPARVMEVILKQRADWLGGDGAPRISVLPQPELDATRPREFAAAVTGLADSLDDINTSGQRIYNLTAGYKGTAILLGIYATLAKLYRGQDSIMYYLFEQAPDLIQLDVEEAYVIAKPVE